MLIEDATIRMRCADAAEKITSKHPEYLASFKEKLIYKFAKINQQEVLWHVIQMLPRLNLNQKERAFEFSILVAYLEDKSKIVKTFSMKALADLAKEDGSLRKKIISLLERQIETGSSAMKNRGKKLLRALQK